MLYSQGNSTFSELSDAMQAYGVSLEVIGIIRNYLDISKDRDDSQLKRIPRYYITNNDWQKRSNLEKAVRHEIIKERSDELIDRFILVSYALYGCNCAVFIGTLDLFQNVEKYYTVMIRTFSSLVGEKAEALAYAVQMCSSAGSFARSYRYYTKTEKKNPKICADTLEFLSENPQIQATMCAYALDQCRIPEKKNGIAGIFSKADIPVIAQTVVEYVRELIGKRQSNVYAGDLIILAAAEASYFDEKCEKYFSHMIKGNAHAIAEKAMNYNIGIDRVLTAVEKYPDAVDNNYVRFIAGYMLANDRDIIRRHLRFIAKNYTDRYIAVMYAISDNDYIAKAMEDLLREVKPDEINAENSLRDTARRRISLDIANRFPDKDEIRSYLLGKTPLSDILSLIDKNHINNSGWGITSKSSYYSAYGADDFLKRCTVLIILAFNRYLPLYSVEHLTGFRYEGKEEILTEFMFEEKVEPGTIVEKCGWIVENSYSNRDEMIFRFAKGIAKHAELAADIDLKDLSVPSRQIYLFALSKADFAKYKENILALSSDTSKAVKEDLVLVLQNQENITEDIISLLQSKKAGQREIAVSVIEKQNSERYTEALQTAFEKEKSEKLKIRIASLIGVKYGDENPEKENSGDIIKELTKGGKAKKVAWLFTQPFRNVHLSDGEIAPEEYLQALLLCYAGMTSAGISRTALDIAEKMNKTDLENFAVEVISRWLELGAAAKTKWVLWFCSVHGGNEIINTLMHYIKEWSDGARGAIAAEAVKAMAMNGSSIALMNVDGMARKFKNKQVRSAAGAALDNAADQLGITTEELADRIVPDMGFDDKMCRTFDYGKRQFSVYLTPSLEIEIFNGDKKVKSMPKPGVNDDAETANASYNAFKEMKKQMKTVVTNQKQRLEYVLMCDRKWTAENWNKLFVKNPVMHCFAIGLIWGVYEDGQLKTSFRYMDDGSFTTSDEDEFELPENAVIGLVHPIELTEDEKNTWIQQLSDYEIVQPFSQLSRPVYTLNDDETGDTIFRFEDKEVNNLSLLGKMQKLGWDKGVAQDAGFFYEFYRNDISKRVKNSDGTFTSVGYVTELTFSGMSIDGYYRDPEDVTIQKLVFYSYDDYKNTPYSQLKPVNVKDINKRYFSEIIMQVSSVVGA